MSEFAKYEAARNAGGTPRDVYLAAMRDGIDAITRIRLIRSVFGLNLAEAKEVAVEAEDGVTLDARQRELASAVELLDPNTGDD